MGIKTIIKNIKTKREMKKAEKAGEVLASQGVTPETPRTTTGDYVVTTPSGTTTVSPTGSTSTSTPSSGGRGGGRGLPSTTQSSLATPTIGAGINQQAAEDTSMPRSTLTPGTPTTGLKSSFNYLRTNIRQDFPGAIKGAGQIAIGGVKNEFQRLQQEKFSRNVIAAEGKYEVSAADRAAALRGATGTATGFSYQQTPDEILIRDAKLGDKAALEAYTERINRQNEAEIKYEVTNKLNEDKIKIDRYTNQLQGLVNSGTITHEQAVEEQKKYAERLDTERNKEINQRYESKIKEQQKNIDSIAKKGRITRLALTTAVSVASGAVVGGVLSAAPKIVQTGAGVVGGVAMIKPTAQVTRGVIRGTAKTLDVAEFILPTAGFIAGGAIGMKLAGKGNVVVDEKLNTAISTSEIRAVKEIKITSEGQINALNIPEAQKLEIISKYRAGESVGYKKWELVNKNKELNSYLKEKLPETEIISYGETQSLNNVYTADTIMRVRVSKGKYEYVDLTTGQTVGIYDPKTKKIYSESLYQRRELGKPVTEIGKTAEVTSVEQRLKLNEGQIKRLLSTESYSFEGMKIKKDVSQPISYKDLQEVVASERFKRKPTFKTKGVELQESIKIGKMDIGLKTGETTGIGVSAKEIKFATENSATRVSEVVSPIEFTRGPTSRKIKPFKLETPELKPSPKGTFPQETELINKDILKQLPEPTPTINLESPQILSLAKESVLTGVKRMQLPKKTKVSAQPAGTLQLKEKQINALSESSLIDFGDIKTGTSQDLIVLPKTKTKGRSKDKLKVTPSPVVIPKDIVTVTTAQKLKVGTVAPLKLKNLQIVSPLVNIPRTPIPKLDILPPPPIRGYNELFGMLNKLKRLSTPKKIRIPKYTTSLGAAAFQTKPIKVSKKEYQRLSKVSFTGAETRPLLEIVPDEKETKKMIKKVQF